MQTSLGSAFDAPERSRPAAIAEGEIIDYDRDDLGRWNLTVRLPGDRPLLGVIPLFGREGTRSGSRASLPPIGACGLILFPDSEVNGDRAYWLGSGDIFTDGLHTERASDEATLHPAGGGWRRDKDGNETRYDLNGDTVHVGPSKTPLKLLVRNQKGEIKESIKFRRGLYRIFDWGLTKLLSLRLGADIVLYGDTLERRLAAFIGSTGAEIEDGRIQVRGETVRVGPEPKLTRPVAIARPAMINDTALAEELAAVRKQLEELQSKFAAHLIEYNTHAPLHTGPVLPSTISVTPLITPSDATGKKVKVIDSASNRLFAE